MAALYRKDVVFSYLNRRKLELVFTIRSLGLKLSRVGVYGRSIRKLAVVACLNGMTTRSKLAHDLLLGHVSLRLPFLNQ